jgi:predicted XRE-type DNA-binding protein
MTTRQKRANLNEAEIREIIRMARAGMPQKAIAAALHIRQNTVSGILRGATHADVTVRVGWDPVTKRTFDKWHGELPPRLVLEVKRLHALGIAQATIAKSVGSTQSVISKLLREERGRHV